MTNTTKTVNLSTYKQVLNLRKQGKLVGDIASILRVNQSEVQKIILHFDKLTQKNAEHDRTNTDQ